MYKRSLCCIGVLLSLLCMLPSSSQSLWLSPANLDLHGVICNTTTYLLIPRSLLSSQQGYDPCSINSVQVTLSSQSGHYESIFTFTDNQSKIVIQNPTNHHKHKHITGTVRYGFNSGAFQDIPVKFDVARKDDLCGGPLGWVHIDVPALRNGHIYYSTDISSEVTFLLHPHDTSSEVAAEIRINEETTYEYTFPSLLRTCDAAPAVTFQGEHLTYHLAVRPLYRTDGSRGLETSATIEQVPTREMLDGAGARSIDEPFANGTLRHYSSNW